MSANISYQTARAMLINIEQYTPSDFGVLGITREQFEEVAQPQNWKREKMHVIMRALSSIMFGSLEIMGVPKVTVPAEFCAAIVATLVHPANRLIACVWLSQERIAGPGALDLAARHEQVQQFDQTTADQLFALVCLLSDTADANVARQRFMERLGMAIEEAENNGEL